MQMYQWSFKSCIFIKSGMSMELCLKIREHVPNGFVSASNFNGKLEEKIRKLAEKYETDETEE